MRSRSRCGSSPPRRWGIGTPRPPSGWAGRTSPAATSCGSRSLPPTATRARSRIRTASTCGARTRASTLPSRAGPTCASACTWRASRRTRRSAGCSSACRACASIRRTRRRPSAWSSASRPSCTCCGPRRETEAQGPSAQFRVVLKLMRDRDSWRGVEVRHLAALDAIARERSFSRAARTLGYTQSAVSQQVALLERIVGARLVERSSGPRPVSLTAAGDVMVRHDRRVVDQLAAARADLAAWSAGSAGELRVGTYHSVGAKILPRVVGRLSAALPGVSVALVETPDEGQLLRLVERGELDVSFMLYPLADGPFAAVELLRDPFLLLVAEDSPLGADGHRPTMAEVMALDLIAYDRVRDATRPETHLRGTPRVVFRSNDDETIHGLVAAGMGAALLPRLSVDPVHPGVRAVELDVGLPPRVIGLAWHRDRDLLPAAREFVATTERVCAELASEQPVETHRR